MRHVLRILFITLALVLIGLALTPRATPAQGTDPCAPNRAIPYGWHLRPAVPCGGDSVAIVFTSCRDCVQILGVERPESGPLQLDLRVRDVCPLTLICRPDSVEMPLGQHAAGNYHLNYVVHAGVVHGDSGFCYVDRPDSLSFLVGCPEPPLPGTLPYTGLIQIGPPPPCNTCAPRICPGEPIPLHIAGGFGDGCYHFRGLELVPSPLMGPRAEPPVVRLHVDWRTCGVCTMGTQSWSADTLLAGLAPGTYNLMLQMVVRHYCDSTTPGDSTTYYATRLFTVKDSCYGEPPPPPPPPPLPPPGSLPFVTRSQIGPPPPCTGCPPRICPGVPIPFAVAGTLPSNCYQFRGLQLLPSPIVGPRQEPPVVRIVVAQNDCMDWPCDNVTRPWAAETRLPGLLPGAYELMMQVAVVSMCDSNRVDTTYYAARSFTVKDTCMAPPAEPCFIAGWDREGHVGACDAIVGPGRPAKVGMTLATQVPLAGLQGTLSFAPAGLRITGLVPTGQAEGMHIAWEPVEDGAKFVMFAEQGAPIAPVRCEAGSRCVQSVLAIVLEPLPGAVLPPVTHLSVHDLFGSDSLGNAVPECQIATLVVVEARICAGPSCDFNLDGQLDVRDLVAMVRCVLGNGTCPDTSLARLDCNGDGRTNVDDVLCCARTILHGGERDTTPGRSEPNVAVQIGEPEWDSGGLRVPIQVLGADRVGAARLALALPLDRYDVTGVELAAGNPQWLELHDVVDGQLVLGLIGLAPGASAEEPAQVDLTLRLGLKPGQGAGGDLGLADVQLAGPDGVTLAAPVTPATVALPSPGALLLSAARPNPFTHETRLALNLDRGTDVDLSVHDLSGRRVATLHHGALGAGPHEFVWRGIGSDGSTAPNGIYFVQARVGGERLTRKVIFLRGN